MKKQAFHFLHSETGGTCHQRLHNLKQLITILVLTFSRSVPLWFRLFGACRPSSQKENARNNSKQSMLVILLSPSSNNVYKRMEETVRLQLNWKETYLKYRAKIIICVFGHISTLALTFLHLVPLWFKLFAVYRPSTQEKNERMNLIKLTPPTLSNPSLSSVY